MKLYETQGYYGGSHTPCTILVYEKYTGVRWYCVEGSVNVNATYDDVDLGVDVETLSDIDCSTASQPINDLDELEAHVDA